MAAVYTGERVGRRWRVLVNGQEMAVCRSVGDAELIVAALKAWAASGSLLVVR